MKKISSFRIDPLAATRLESMAKKVGLSQANLIEQLISAAFNSSSKNWDAKGFQTFCESVSDREKFLSQGESPE